ncbi:MAG TPA: nucleoside-diphosphate sugar epimerase/dehydratase [Candidatus Polarisedimenticolia bacterium]|jgi:FlaA1/EpsC-like NDP-sugar epimerase|nr:nucleoside-diphosphate sugar epimerase/dehydratase [Candidatus Polarisedimenticolia bacterium]
MRLNRHRTKLLFVAGDVLAVLLANVLALALRFDFKWASITDPAFRASELLLIDLILTPVVFYVMGLYQSYWKYTGLDDLLRLVRAVAYRTAGVIILFYALGFVGLSRAVVIINSVLLLMLTGLLRLGPRFHFEFFSARRRSSGRRTLIVGAGDTGESLLRELKKTPHLDYNPIGFVDDDVEKIGIVIHGVPVLGDTRSLEKTIEEYGAREVIIAIPGASGNAMREIFDVCRRTGARFRTVPTRGELQRGAARVSQIRLVDLEDLLGREVVSLDNQMLRMSLSGKRVLVTGAAGSIGRELARQIASYEPDLLVVLDRNENNLFYLEAELREGHPLLNLVAAVGDVLDQRRLARLFEEHRPRVVFHAAAYKHVPLMEGNSVEAIKNNVLATRILSQAAIDAGVERLIYISTDKAVRPTSVMGATKRLGERLVKSLGTEATRFIAVRFGNVLGSDGSVVPTFRKQIAAGGPVTITHPEATRYFMTIPEAVQLVLMAGAMGEGNETFLLQMGQPVRIVDMARNMIELSGLRPDEDIKIVFTGLRPGEKLHEELKNDAEEALPTSNDKIMILTGVEPLGRGEWSDLEALEEGALEGRSDEVLAVLRRLVPDYVPDVAMPPRMSGIPGQKVVDLFPKRRLDAQI